MAEYDWEAMARRIEQGLAPRPLPEILRGIYELGFRDGSGAEPDAIDEAGAHLRAQRQSGTGTEEEP